MAKSVVFKGTQEQYSRAARKYKPARVRSYKTSDGREIEVPNHKFYVVNQTTKFSGAMATNDPAFDSLEAAADKADARLREFVSMRLTYLLPVLVVSAPNKKAAEHPMMVTDSDRKIWWVNGKFLKAPVTGEGLPKKTRSDPEQPRLPGLARGLKRTPTGLDGRFHYVPFAGLDADDQRAVPRQYQNHAPGVEHRQYMYPVNSSGRLVAARRYLPPKSRRKEFERLGLATGKKMSASSAARAISVGDKIWFTDPRAGTRSGKAMLRGDYGWVVALDRKFGGSRHGTPVVVDDDTIIQVVKSKPGHAGGHSGDCGCGQ